MAYNKNENNYTNIAAATGGVQIFTGKGILRAVVVNTTAAGTIAITDAVLTPTTGTTGNVGIIQTSVLPGTFLYDVTIANGLTIAAGAASNATIVWSKD